MDLNWQNIAVALAVLAAVVYLARQCRGKKQNSSSCHCPTSCKRR